MKETNPFIKCKNCNSLWGEGSGRDNYHNRGYCRKYSYDEYLKLMNEYPAKEYTEEEKIKLGLLPKNASWRKSNSLEFMQEYSCFPVDNKVVSHPVFGSATYIPEIRQITKDAIYSAISALESGLEYAQECLIRHDQNLGRTIPRNKREAEYMEEDIEKIKSAIKELKS